MLVSYIEVVIKFGCITVRFIYLQSICVANLSITPIPKIILSSSLLTFIMSSSIGTILITSTVSLVNKITSQVFNKSPFLLLIFTSSLNKILTFPCSLISLILSTTFSNAILLNVLKEFDIKLEKIFYQKYEMLKKEEEYLEEYLKAYKNGEINCVFTAFGYIYNVLKEKKIPVYRIQATNIEIENEFKALLNRIELVNNRKGKIGIEIIKLESLNMNLDNNLENKMKIEKKLLEYAKELEGNIQTSDKKEYIIISNIEVLKNTENLKRIFSLQNELELLEEKIVVGIGEGNTIFQAEKNARISLKLSLNKNGKIFYSNGEKIKGPLYSSKELEYKKVSSKRMKKIADEIGINSSYLEKIKGIMCKKKKDEFTSSEIAEILNITQRSTNRILKKIIEKDYAESVQVENSVGVGRPKRIIKFKIN